MLPKRARLSKRKEIQAVLKKRQYKGSSPLLSFVACENELTRSRFLVVAKKKLGSATKRNRLRRVYSEAFSKICRNISKKCDLVVFPGSQSVGLGANEALGALSKLLLRKGLLNDSKVS
ncbi:ribonuclease P protein component [Candidatus Margulisiibacteriota bacterium]